MIINLVMGSMTWAGVRVGVVVNGALAVGGKVSLDSGGKAGGRIGKLAIILSAQRCITMRLSVD
ncbi:hypothetical protein CRJUMX02_1880003 [Escherichia coli]|nr:hypothetical protein CRJUMX02_1880003 [Escherichia coli]